MMPLTSQPETRPFLSKSLFWSISDSNHDFQCAKAQVIYLSALVWPSDSDGIQGQGESLPCLANEKTEVERQVNHRGLIIKSVTGLWAYTEG